MPHLDDNVTGRAQRSDYARQTMRAVTKQHLLGPGSKRIIGTRAIPASQSLGFGAPPEQAPVAEKWIRTGDAPGRTPEGVLRP